jgi:PIN domain nuclease of toxin-antitoxin system
VDVGLDRQWCALSGSTRTMTLLDTNVLIWAQKSHPRARKVMRDGRLYVSPATLLELQYLHEAGKIRLVPGAMRAIVDDDRWAVDDPPPTTWFLKAVELAWTRDPFDRLIAAHAQVRGWRVATSDRNLIEHLGAACIEL